MTDTDIQPTDVVLPGTTTRVVCLPTTPAQVEIWLSEQTGSGASGAYNESVSVRMEGDIDDASLEQALRTLPEFHESLRGRFSEDGQTFLIDPVLDLPVVRHDLSSLPPQKRAAEVARITRLDSSTPYSLSTGPLFRVAIMTLDPRTRVVLLGAHHLVCDAWSFEVLLADVGRIYSALAAKAPLPDPPKHGYSDFVATRGTADFKAATEESRAYWRQTFATAPDPLALPEDRKRPLTRSYGAVHDGLDLAPEALSKLRAFAQRNEISLFSVLFAGVATLLHRISGAPDLVVGVPVAGHPGAGMEDAVGNLMNVLPVRVRFAGDTTFLGLCGQVSAAVLDARKHAQLGFAEIAHDLKLPRDPSRVPLAPVLFNHGLKPEPGALSFGGCTVDITPTWRPFETFEFTVSAVESPHSVHLHAHANSQLYSQQWVHFRLRELLQLLRGLVAAPSRPVAAVPFLPKEEMDILVAEAARTRADYPRDAIIADLFSRHVAATPDATAIRFGDAAITYAALDARANRIARVLRQRGVARGALVGICLERGIPMVAAMLAVQKAGAGYIPLDPGFPPDRLAYMVEDSKLAAVISQAALAPMHGCDAGRTLELDTHADAVDAESDDPLPRDDNSAGPPDTAYVLYTSGSTGKPKGVAVPHRAAVNFLESMRFEPGLSRADVLLAVTTLSFDIALLELMGTLAAGGTIVLATRDQAMDGEALQRLIADHGVTVLQATPVTWRLLLATGWRGNRALKALIGGEALPRDLAVALVPMVGQLWNMYGPTETTVWSTCGRIENPNAAIDIGRPVANTSVWILDPHGNPCPVGVVGEIHIGGDGVALGYLGRPELTAEKFIPDPFDKTPGARLYRTGDLGRLRRDGRLECLGRIDFQVKVRGFRIELGEIENVLSKHPDVQQAVVVARTDRGSEAYLAAYLQTVSGAADAQALRAHLKQSLPDYMVPQHFMVLTEFPLTPNGKIDRKALPAPEAAPNPGAAHDVVDPRNDLETRIGLIFADVLGVQRVGIDQDFFSLGGTSVSAVAACARIEQQLKMKIPLRVFFESPTVEALAKQNPNPEQADDPIVVTLQKGSPDRIPLFCMMGVHLYQDLARHFTDGTRVVGIHVPIRYVPGKEEVPCLSAVAKRYVDAIRRERPAGPYALAGLCFGGLVAYEVARILRTAGEKVALVATFDANLPRAIEKDPLTHLRCGIAQAARDPSTAAKKLFDLAEGRAMALLARFRPPALVTRQLAPAPTAADPAPVDLPIDGPEMQAHVAYFEAQSPYLDVPLLVYRATGEPQPPWITIRPDMGWSGFSKTIELHDVPADHMRIVRDPHAERLARSIMRVLSNATS